MAEAIWQELGKGDWQASSAGSDPAGYVHPLAVRVLSEIGIDISTNVSKSVSQFEGEHFDLVVTVCDNAKSSCPVFPSATEVLHWPFEDPAHATGTDEKKLAVFRQVRDQIRQTIADYLGS